MLQEWRFRICIRYLPAGCISHFLIKLLLASVLNLEFTFRSSQATFPAHGLTTVSQSTRHPCILHHCWWKCRMSCSWFSKKGVLLPTKLYSIDIIWKVNITVPRKMAFLTERCLKIWRTRHPIPKSQNLESKSSDSKWKGQLNKGRPIWRYNSFFRDKMWHRQII